MEQYQIKIQKNYKMIETYEVWKAPQKSAVGNN